AGEARQGDDGLARTALRVDAAQPAGARFEHPETVAVPARRMRHRQAAADDALAVQVDQLAAVGLALAPAAGDVAAAEQGHVAHRRPVEMAATLGASALRKDGFHCGTKLASGAKVQRQQKRVLTAQSVSPAQASSWMSMLPVVCTARGTHAMSTWPSGASLAA